MALASAETAALLLTNHRQHWIIAGLLVVAFLMGVALLYMVYLNRTMRYTTLSGGVSLAMPGELDETVVADFAESVVSRLGNVGPESIDGVKTWVLRRAHPGMRARFDAWLEREKALIVAEDMVFQLENPTVVAIEKVSVVGTPVYRMRVRGRQTIWIVSQPIKPRLIDITMTVTVGPVGTSTDLVIKTLNIPELLTVEGAVVHVIQESS